MSAAQNPPPGRVRVWDLPTRLFHWSLALCVGAALISAQSGGYTAQRVHYLCGYAVLVLVVFRAAWGFAGPCYARFSQFLQGPSATLRYALGLLASATPAVAPGYPGHNPLGALSVLALLGACGAQAVSGLFSKDDIASEGPLARHVSEALVNRFTSAHDAGQTVLYVLLCLHLAAIVFYRVVKRENLVGPMITGDKRLPEGVLAPSAQDRPLWPRAALLLGASLLLVCLLVNWG